MKMRAVLRYRRLPYLFLTNTGGEGPIAEVRPRVIPVLRFPDGSLHVDSTPMIEELEARHPGQRSIVPADPVHAFLAFLLEDFADEWVTKMMFHYRWYYEIDQLTFAREGAFDRTLGRRRIEEELVPAFRARQVGRMPLVGCTEENRPLIEGTFEELCTVLDRHVTEQRFLFGSRPSRADFALYGQLSQLASDPTPSGRMREIAPYTFRWVRQVDDLCGVEGEWLPGDAPLPEAVSEILRMAGEVYLPFLQANARALEAGQERFELAIRGRRYAQASFKYQGKCLAELRRRFGALEGAERAGVEAVLKETGGLEILAP
jgi:glutathione S-transferase